MQALPRDLHQQCELGLVVSRADVVDPDHGLAQRSRTDCDSYADPGVTHVLELQRAGSGVFEITDELSPRIQAGTGTREGVGGAAEDLVNLPAVVQPALNRR
jgi:hypothetical protein